MHTCTNKHKRTAEYNLHVLVQTRLGIKATEDDAVQVGANRSDLLDEVCNLNQK